MGDTTEEHKSIYITAEAWCHAKKMHSGMLIIWWGQHFSLFEW